MIAIFTRRGADTRWGPDNAALLTEPGSRAQSSTTLQGRRKPTAEAYVRAACLRGTCTDNAGMCALMMSTARVPRDAPTMTVATA